MTILYNTSAESSKKMEDLLAGPNVTYRNSITSKSDKKASHEKNPGR